jgi:hypothetical protein|tara:strand:- start:2910 stop:3335 length:426 start_codon:yes stop_codon:yes gene_type:complete
MAEILCRRTLAGLTPLDEDGWEMLQCWSINDILKVKVTKPRNLAHHRKFFGLLGVIVHNQEFYKSTDHLLLWLKHRLGLVDMVPTHDGTSRIREQSISFAVMDDTQFTAFYDQAVDVLCTEVIPGLDKRELEEEVMEILGG